MNKLTELQTKISEKMEWARYWFNAKYRAINAQDEYKDYLSNIERTYEKIKSGKLNVGIPKNSPYKTWDEAIEATKKTIAKYDEDIAVDQKGLDDCKREMIKMYREIAALSDEELSPDPESTRKSYLTKAKTMEDSIGKSWTDEYKEDITGISYINEITGASTREVDI